MTAKWSILIIWGLSTVAVANSQCPDRQSVWDSILAIEKTAQASLPESKKKLLSLKNTFETCGLEKDSVYARLLHRLAAVSYQGNHNIATDESISHLSEAIRINSSGKANAAPAYLVNNYYNMGLFYQSLNSYRKASLYYDSTIVTDARLHTGNPFALSAGYYRAHCFFENGEYQKSIDECSRFLVVARSLQNHDMEMRLLNTQSQSYWYLERLSEAMESATRAGLFARRLNSSYELASSLKNQARVLAKQRRHEQATELFTEMIRERLKTSAYLQVAEDYIDFGLFYLNGSDYQQAKACFRKAIDYAQKGDHKDQLAKASLNLSVVEIEAPAKNYASAEQYLKRSFQHLAIEKSNLYDDIYLRELAGIGDRKLLVHILRTKAGLLMQLYKEGSQQSLDMCIKTAKLTDSLLTEMRMQHTEERSKLNWLDLTRDFFALTLEACYLSGNMDMAFYFMEKSRAVLLYEKINEHAATLLLPEPEIRKERQFKYQIAAVESLLGRGIDVNRHQLQLIQLKDSLQHHITFLENNYPEYYRIKYATALPSLQDFRQYLSVNGEAFIHYFFHEKHGFAFVASASGAEMYKIDVSPSDLADFMHLCSSKQSQNSQYLAFEKLAEKLYAQLFAPLGVEQERVIVCMDNYLLPFEALRTDTPTPEFLISHHTFSYAYSAAALLFQKKHRISPTSMFAGFAPISFAKELSLPDLKLSGKWLDRLTAFYSSNQIFTKEGATRQNFIHSLSSYSIVNVFSHAIADTIEKEPMLYLQDSAINLRELQSLDPAAAQLVILSACQTNVGRNESGEGIYSLARGFSTIGIPSVTSTLWTADEASTYWISEKFHHYLREGMNKDIALKKAKLDFMQSGARASLLPYYWANIVLVGNNSIIDFTDFRKLRITDAVIVLLLAIGGLTAWWLLTRLIHK